MIDVLDIPYEQRLVFGNMTAEVFYKTSEWKRLRYRALRTLGNRCQLCGATAQQAVLHVDHIRPRHNHPELCLDMRNLQILCADCHTAKGAQLADDFRGQFTRYQPNSIRDVLRITRFHLVLEDRPPTCSREAHFFSENVTCPLKMYHSRWRLLIKFLHGYKTTYSVARGLTVGAFLQIPQLKHKKYNRMLEKKRPDDPLFDMGGMRFPLTLAELLED